MVNPGVICDNAFNGAQVFAVAPAVGVADQTNRPSTLAGGFSGVGCGRSESGVSSVHDGMDLAMSLPPGQRHANEQTIERWKMH
jgi:hypothetical protein